MLTATGNPPPSNHQRKSSTTQPQAGHELCQHTWRLVREEALPMLRGSNAYLFRCYCLVTRRWMKTLVPVFYFWLGDRSYGRPEVQYGEISVEEIS